MVKRKSVSLLLCHTTYLSKLTEITRTLRQDLSTFITVSPSVLLRMKMLQTILNKIQNTFYIQQFFLQNRSVYEIKWKNMEQTDRQTTNDNIIRHMRVACWINKERIQKHTHNI